MPLVRIDLCRGKTAVHRAAIRDGVYRALCATFDVPEDDRFAIVTEHNPEDFSFDRSYLGVERSDDLVVVQLTVSRTRGVAQKKALYAAIAHNLSDEPGLRPDDVLVILAENGREDWSFGRGVASYIP
ncbi:tautomerase family protein [Lichenibacterium minor]|uniref:Tautomerase family protein n=1 Tax=Lichenibacterium minor TaxID=2316528 RepID=A0A4Q2UAS5_9HYPH|nr:tautomerase family protein [Lichenibacterium minor]RYC33078.1 tautomerase family protein [Lichenibacterium minor]